MSRFLNLIACCFLLLGSAFEAASQTATLTPGQTYNGTLSSSDTSLDTGEYFQCFNLNVQPNQNIVATLRSSQFDTTLAAGTGRCGGSDVNLNMINDDFEETSTDSQLSFATSQQEYILAVTSYGPGETGSFTLTVEGPGGTNSNKDTPSDDAPFQVGTIGVGQQYSGNLTSNSLSLDDGQHVQCIDLNLQANQEVTVTLRSQQFDTQLFMGTGRCLGEFDLTMVNDDFEDGSRDSQLRVTPTQNQYTAVISSYGAGETGSYTLYVESGSGTQSSTTSTTTEDDDSNVGADYLLYGVIPNPIPEGMIFGTASGKQRTAEHTIHVPEDLTSFFTIGMCDFVNCLQISLTMIGEDGTEFQGQAAADNEIGGIDILSTENLPAGTYRIRVSVPDCNGSCRYTLTGMF